MAPRLRPRSGRPPLELGGANAFAIRSTTRPRARERPGESPVKDALENRAKAWVSEGLGRPPGGASTNREDALPAARVRPRAWLGARRQHPPAHLAELGPVRGPAAEDDLVPVLEEPLAAEELDHRAL